MNPAYAAAQSQGQGYQQPYPTNKVTGAYVSPQSAMSGGQPGYQGYNNPNHAAQSNMSGAWVPPAAKKSPLWPWILAGCIIASLAGGTGYVVAMMKKEPTEPIEQLITAGHPSGCVG